MNAEAHTRLPKWLVVSGWVLYAGTLLLVGRLVFERTYLTWKHGPQMIGFSFVHLYPSLFIISVASFYLTHVWAVAALVIAIPTARSLALSNWLLVGLVVVTITLEYVPEEYWQAALRACLGGTS